MRACSGGIDKFGVIKYTYLTDPFPSPACAGTTKKGIGPAYASKINRVGLRFGDLRFWNDFEERFRVRAYIQQAVNQSIIPLEVSALSLTGACTTPSFPLFSNYDDAGHTLTHPTSQALVKAVESQYPRIKIDVEKELQFYKDKRPLLLPLIADTIDYTNDAFDGGRKILVEGANATMLDIDFGTYPYVTSSNPSIGSVCTGLGVAPNKLGEIIGTVKAVSALAFAMCWHQSIRNDPSQPLCGSID